MAKTTIFFGILLIVLGAVGYFGTPLDDSGSADDPAQTETVDGAPAETDDGEPKSKRSVTALIPAMVGGLLLLCGLLAMQEGMRMHAMHAAVIVGLLGALAGLGRGCMGLGKFMSGDPSLNMRSFTFVWLMAIICIVYVALCIRSFIEARRQRQQAEGTG